MIKENEYTPSKKFKVPTPNTRQGIRLEEKIQDLAYSLAQDLEKDPREARPLFQQFAESLAGSWPDWVMKEFDHWANIIHAQRKRAQDWLEQIPDGDILEEFGDWLPVESHRRNILEQALGISRYNYSANAGFKRTAEEHPAGIADLALAMGEEIKEAWEFEKYNLPLPVDQDIRRDYNYNTRLGAGSKKPAVREAWTSFFGAWWQMQNNITVSDQIFAERLRLIVEIDGARKQYENLKNKLTKPLEDYASFYVYSRWSKNTDDREYKHKGAQATWAAKKTLDDLEQLYRENEERINYPNWSIDSLVTDVVNTHGVFIAIWQHEEKELAKKKEAEAEKRQKREKKLSKLQQLAEKPIVVECVQDGDRYFFDHRSLLEQLAGRASISKNYGFSWIKFIGLHVELSFLRQWLVLVLQDPATGRRVPTKKWSQWHWASVSFIPTKKGFTDEDTFGLAFSVQCGNIRLATTLYDLSDEVEFAKGSGRKPVVHQVKLKPVKADVPKTRGMWTPEDLNEYQPTVYA